MGKICSGLSKEITRGKEAYLQQEGVLRFARRVLKKNTEKKIQKQIFLVTSKKESLKNGFLIF